MEVDASQQKQPQGNSQKGGKKSQTELKNKWTFMQLMKGKCFGCGSTDHTKPQGGHKHEICSHCGKNGHRPNICMAKYLEKPKVEKAKASKEKVKSPSTSGDTKKNEAEALRQQIAEMQAQIQALSASGF